MNYNKHSFTKMSGLISQNSSGQSNKERETMHKYLGPLIQQLKYNGIEEFPDFCSPLKNSGFSCEKIKEFLIDIVEYLQIKSIVKTRLISKSNCSEKNLIFSWICVFYPNELIQYISSLLKENIIIPKNNFDLKSGIEAGIDQIQKQKENKSLNLEKLKIDVNLNNSKIELDQSNDDFNQLTELFDQSNDEFDQLNTVFDCDGLEMNYFL